MENQNNKDLKCDILLITVTDIEFSSLIKEFKSQYDKDPTRSFGKNKTYFDMGEIKGSRIYIVRSEMGSDSVGGSTTTTTDAIWETSPKYIIMLGISFGMDENNQKIGDILVSRQLQTYELQRVGTNQGKTTIQPRGDKVSASVVLIDRFRTSALSWKHSQVFFCLMLSGQKLVDNKNYRNMLSEFFPEAKGGEMEATGLYAAAKDTPWIIVKAICDFADGEKKKNKESNQTVAAQFAAQYVLHTIAEGGIQDQKRQTAITYNTVKSTNNESTNEILSLIKQKDAEIEKLYDLKISHAAHRFKDGTIGSFFKPSSTRDFSPPPECYEDHEEKFGQYIHELKEMKELLSTLSKHQDPTMYDYYKRRHQRGFDNIDKIVDAHRFGPGSCSKK